MRKKVYKFKIVQIFGVLRNKNVSDLILLSEYAINMTHTGINDNKKFAK
jgi:hypothetical protein